jgi:hypothetical protein
VAALALAACGGDDAFSPTPATVQGEYNASRFTATSPQGNVNLLSLGATVHVVLNADGTTTGHLSVPDLGLGEGPIEADLTGTWTLSGNTVTFNQTADTFIRDVHFTAALNSLDGEGTFAGTTVHLTLSKTG